MKKWAVDVKKSFSHGDKNNPEQFGYEVSVVHVDNKHGFASYGWGGDKKIIVGAKSLDDYAAAFMFEEFVRLAERLATDLNSKGCDFV